MKILDKAARLEKALLARIGRRADIARHPLELYQAVLDDIENACEPGARGGRIFPYNDVVVSVATSDARNRATAEAIFAEAPTLQDRIRMRLRQAGCVDVESIAVSVKFPDAAGPDWSEREYHIDLRRRRPARESVSRRKQAPTRAVEVHLVVVSGKAERARYVLRDTRINLGRLTSIVDRQQRIIRHNHVAFLDSDDRINQSVSRTHAHLRFDRTSGDARVHDDGSTHGTRVIRDGRTLDVPRGGRGIALRDGDELLLGEARLRIALKPAGRSAK